MVLNHLTHQVPPLRLRRLAIRTQLNKAIFSNKREARTNQNARNHGMGWLSPETRGKLERGHHSRIIE